MKVLFVSDRELTYDGSQLRSHWAFTRFDLQGDSLIAFIGAAQVQPDKLVDLVDRKREEGVYSPRMLHFIAEFFDLDLEKTVLRQRLLMTVIKEAIDELLRTAAAPSRVDRAGDDLFIEGQGKPRKLSVSIATLSPVSGLIHAGLNIETEGVPVLAAGLKDLGIEAERLALKVLEGFAREMDEVDLARTKVRGVE